MQPRGRYVKLNAVDYVLIVALVLLLLTLPIRGILYFRNAAADNTCEANVAFVVRRVDAGTLTTLQTGEEPFCLTDGRTLPATSLVRIGHTVEYVPDENGNLQAVESPSTYDVYFSFRGEGGRAKDGTFLLFGNRRLSVGESLALTRGAYSYTADLITVQIS